MNRSHTSHSFFYAALLVIATLFFVAVGSGADRTGPSKRSTEAILLSLQEKDIDIGVAAFAFAKEVYPSVDISSYSARIDAIADEVRAIARNSTDPEFRVRCLNTVIHQREKFWASRDTSFNRQRDNYYLNRVLDTKQGNCFSLPLLYVAVAQRLGWPVYLVHVPDHTFVRYVDAHLTEQNIEATSGGGYVPDAQYAKDFRVSKKGQKNGAYLRTLSHRELLGDLAAMNAVTFGQDGALNKSIGNFELATKLNPKLVEAWNNLAKLYAVVGKNAAKTESDRFFSQSARCAKERDELGFVSPKSVPQFAENGKPIKQGINLQYRTK